MSRDQSGDCLDFKFLALGAQRLSVKERKDRSTEAVNRGEKNEL